MRPLIISTFRGKTTFAAFGVLQQIVKNGSLAIISLSLAKLLQNEEFALYGILLSFHSFFSLVHAAFLTEPMLLYGRRDFNRSIHSYFQRLLTLHCYIVAAFVFLIFSAALAIYLSGQNSFAWGLLWLGLSLPFVLLANLLERVFIVLLCPKPPVLASILNATLYAFGLVIFHKTAEVTIAVAFSLMLFAAAFSSLLLYRTLRSVHLDGAEVPKERLEYVIAKHLRFGLPSCAAHLLWWCVVNTYVLLLPVLHGLSQTAHYKLLVTFTNPATMLFSAIGLVLLPLLAGAEDGKQFMRILAGASIGVVVIGFAFFTVFGSLGCMLVHHLYKDKFIFAIHTYWIAGLYPLSAGLYYISITCSRALDKPVVAFKAAAVCFFGTLPIGILMAKELGIDGAFLGQMLTVLMTAGVVFASVIWYSGGMFSRSR